LEAHLVAKYLTHVNKRVFLQELVEDANGGSETYRIHSNTKFQSSSNFLRHKNNRDLSHRNEGSIFPLVVGNIFVFQSEWTRSTHTVGAIFFLRVLPM
jgi:hypothetical protein